MRLCGQSWSRTSVFSRTAPTHWNPGEVVDPASGQPFTDEGAWLHVQSLIAGGCNIVPVVLEKPPGKTGWVMRFADGIGANVYVKLQLGSGLVIGRSFHLG